MGLTTTAHAQAAEATKAAVEAGGVLLQYQVLGAFSVILLLAVGLLFWLLLRSYDRYHALVERVVSIAETSKATSASITAAMATLVSTLTDTTKAVQDLAHEAEGEARDNRHLLGQVAQVVNGLAERLERFFDRGAK